MVYSPHADVERVRSRDGDRRNDRFRCKVCVEHAVNRDLQACTFSRSQVKAHPNTKKHREALIRRNQSLRQQREATVVGPTPGVVRFSSPYLNSPPREQLQHNLFRDARYIDNTWLDEQGNELCAPLMVTDDQNWASQRAQDFWHDVDTARSHGEPPENRWHFLSDDNSSSTSSESDDTEHEMPGAVSEAESTGFAPYPSKTVSFYRQAKKRN